MKRKDLEHIIRAAADIADDDELIVVGSQAILGQLPDAPSELLASNEADLYPKNKPERSDLIDGSIGEGSPFHDTFGYYAHGVGPETAVLPKGWEGRLVAVRNQNTRGVTAWCVEVHDLILSKCVVGREKDLRFLGDAATHGLVQETTLLERLTDMPIDEKMRALVRERILHAFRRVC